MIANSSKKEIPVRKNPDRERMLSQSTDAWALELRSRRALSSHAHRKSNKKTPNENLKTKT